MAIEREPCRHFLLKGPEIVHTAPVHREESRAPERLPTCCSSAQSDGHPCVLPPLASITESSPSPHDPKRAGRRMDVLKDDLRCVSALGEGDEETPPGAHPGGEWGSGGRGEGGGEGPGCRGVQPVNTGCLQPISWSPFWDSHPAKSPGNARLSQRTEIQPVRCLTQQPQFSPSEEAAQGRCCEPQPPAAKKMILSLLPHLGHNQQ